MPTETIGSVAVLDVLADPDVVEAVEALIAAQRRLHDANATIPDYASNPHAYPAAAQARRQATFVATEEHRNALSRLTHVLERRVGDVVKAEAAR